MTFELANTSLACKVQTHEDSIAHFAGGEKNIPQ
jgi:hypothetical protein